jgi:uncharacterized membrane protein
MDATHIHLALTHFPIMASVIGVGILVYGLLAKNDTAKKIALIVFILAAVVTIPVYLTGEEAEETVEHFEGITHDVIEEHEELAEKAIILMGLLAAMSVVSLLSIVKKKPFARIATTATLVVSLVTFGVFAQVGSFGGQIRHTEIRTDNPESNGNDEPLEHGEDDHDDEHDHGH